MLGLDTDTIYQAVQQAVHVSFTTRQSRKGEISSWKAYAPAHAGKLAIEAVDRAMRGEKSPSPIYEGEDSVIAWMLGGTDAVYDVPLPAPGEPCRAILDSYTKEHSAEYQAQAWIDLAFRLRKQIPDLNAIREIIIHTSHHTHYVIGTGASDPQKMRSESPAAKRSITASCSSSPRRCTPASGITSRATRPKWCGTRTSSRSGKRSTPSKTRSGRAAIMRPIRAKRPSADGSKSLCADGRETRG